MGIPPLFSHKDTVMSQHTPGTPGAAAPGSPARLVALGTSLAEAILNERARTATDIEALRAAIGHRLTGGTSQAELLSAMIRHALQDLLTRLVEAYIPESMHEQLIPAARSLSRDPLVLARTIMEDNTPDRLRHEATYALALGYLALRIHGEDSVTLRHQRKQTRHGARAVLRLLYERGVITAPKPTPCTVVCHFERAEPYRVTHHEITVSGVARRHKKKHGSLIWYKEPFLTMVGDPPLGVLFGTRQKGTVSTIAKMLRRPNGTVLAEEIPDRRGFRLAYQDTHAMHLGAQRFLRVAEAHLRKEQEGDGQRTVNAYAAPNLHLVSDAIFVQGKRVEGQHLPLHDLINIIASHGPENWRLYNLRKYMVLFQEVFPTTIYGVDWTSPKVIKELTAFVHQSLHR